jgi:hypothetical protein
MDSGMESRNTCRKGGGRMSEDSYYILADRISNLEKHVKILTDLFNEISPAVRKLSQSIK